MSRLLRSVQLTVALVAVCVLLVVAAGFAWWRTTSGSAGQPVGAVTSVSARADGLRLAGTRAATVLSYDWRTLDQDAARAEAVSAPGFRSQYAASLAKVRAQTLAGKVSLVARPVATSVVSASEEKIVALVFLDQVTSASGLSTSRLARNRVLVTLTRDAGEWRVSRMNAF